MSNAKKFFVVILLVVAVVIIVTVALRTNTFGNFFISGITPGAEASGYQAVFLTNNQVYFGKLSSQNAQFPVLREIYYLQVNNTDGAQIRAEDVNLVKLVSELHGPEDEMRINRDNILLIEDLKKN